jgi:hypothetical protein
VSSEDRTGARAPSASYCSTEGVAPLHTAPPVSKLVMAIFTLKMYSFFICQFKWSSNKNILTVYFG